MNGKSLVLLKPLQSRGEVLSYGFPSQAGEVATVGDRSEAPSWMDVCGVLVSGGLLYVCGLEEGGEGFLVGFSHDWWQLL